LQNVFFGLVLIGTYLAILYFARLTYKQLRLHAAKLSPKTLQMQKQFSRMLWMQVSILIKFITFSSSKICPLNIKILVNGAFITGCWSNS
jgi:hypothetical protein